MSTQPLTNANKKAIFVAKNASTVANTLIPYGFPVDAGMVQPELTYWVFATRADFDTYIANNGDDTVPWAIVGAGMDAELRDALTLRMRLTFGPEKSVADVLRVINNEYAIDPRKLRT